MIASGSAPGSTQEARCCPSASATAPAAATSTATSFFRQKRDPTNRRGYFQKSVVILSHLPLSWVCLAKWRAPRAALL